MKFIDEVDLELVNQELNFTSLDANLVIKGGCDLFTTKPIGSDRKLFKTIDKHLKQILEDNELSKSIDYERKQSLTSIFGSSTSPSHASYPARRPSGSTRRRSSASSITSDPDISESPVTGTHHGQEDVIFTDESPFGSLKEASTRKVFAYLIAILNTTYADHDFSNLQPTTENFRKVDSIDDLIHRFNNVMMSLGKKEETLSWIWDTINVYMEIQSSRPPAINDPTAHLRSGISTANQHASHEGQLEDRGCKVYEFQPSDQSILEDLHYPYQMMWSNYWFIYNKKKKRVCFLYLTAINRVHYAQVTRARSPFNETDSKDISENQKGSLVSTDDEFMDEIGAAEMGEEDFDAMDSNDIIGDMEL